MNDCEIGLYELSDYIFSCDMVERIKAEKVEVIESLYDDCVPTTVQLNDIGQLVPMTVNVEDMAIYIIEKKASYDKMIERYQDKAILFEQAMNSLTDRERQVIQVRYFHRKNDLGLSPEYFRAVLQGAEGKLCAAICELRSNKKKEWQQIVKQERIKQVQEWKQAN